MKTDCCLASSCLSCDEKKARYTHNRSLLDVWKSADRQLHTSLDASSPNVGGVSWQLDYKLSLRLHRSVKVVM